MIEEKEWEQIRPNGFIRWWINEGIIKFLLPIFVINVFFLNPIIMDIGISYFISDHFIKSIFMNGILLSILSLLKAIVTWYVIDRQYKRGVK